MSAHTEGKRVSWVELYLDLIFVLAISQLSHVIVAEPGFDSVWTALGLFAVLWWTWIGFVVLYNREAGDTSRARLLFLVGSVATGVAAVAIEPASLDEPTAFAVAMAAVRVVLAAARPVLGGLRRDPTRLRITGTYLLSAVLFAVSIALPSPWIYVLWGVAVLLESLVLLGGRERDLEAATTTEPTDPLDAHHFAERFGLFLIILLGELVISAGETSVEGHVSTAGGWAGLVAAMILAGALWWLYFNAAVEINLRVLQMAGGSPAIARGLFAVGHMLPAFALLLTAAGVGLLLDGEPPDAAYWLVSSGVGIYLIGTRIFFTVTNLVGHFVRVAVVIATFELAQLEDVVSPHTFLWIVAGWTVGCTALATWQSRVVDDDLVKRFAGSRR